MKRLDLLKIFVVVLLLVGGRAYAQLDSCNVFLKGNYVEVGINWNGAYGSSVSAPDGYHPNGPASLFNSVACGAGDCTTGRNLGFVVDAAKDGWDVGTPPFYGDYFLPGDPEEGWSIMADGMQANAFNEDDEVAPTGAGGCDTTITSEWVYTVDSALGMDTITYSYWDYTYSYDTVSGYYYYYDSLGYLDSMAYTYDSATGIIDSTLYTYTYYSPYFDSTWVSDTVIHCSVVGENISYSNTGGVITGTWVGMFDSIVIQQVTTLDTGDVSFSTTVTLTNIASTGRNGVYYMRTVDPDNDEPETSDFATHNVIEWQLPNAYNLTSVSAAGIEDSDAYLSLTTTDLTARCYIMNYGLTPRSGSLADIYANTGAATGNYMYSGSNSLDVGIGIVYNVGYLSGADTIGAVDTGTSGKMTETIHPNQARVHYSYSFNRPSTTGVGIINNPMIKVYPNPVNDQLNITALNDGDAVMLYDMMGRNVRLNGTIDAGGTSTFSTQGIPAGSYILQVIDKHGTPQTRMPLQKL